MTKTRMNYKVKFVLLGLCGALLGRLYGAQANRALTVQKVDAVHHQAEKKPQQVAKAGKSLLSEQSDFHQFCQFYNIPKEKMETKAYQDLFLEVKQQEAADEEKYALAREVYIIKFYDLTEEKREKAVVNKMFLLKVGVKKHRINEVKRKIKRLERKSIGDWLTQRKSKTHKKCTFVLSFYGDR